jgi:hypothetical protein
LHTIHGVPGASAVFETDPKFDSQFNPLLKTFRAVPRTDFGFTVALQVTEDLPPPRAVAPLPTPRGFAPMPSSPEK